MTNDADAGSNDARSFTRKHNLIMVLSPGSSIRVFAKAFNSRTGLGSVLPGAATKSSMTSFAGYVPELGDLQGDEAFVPG